MNLALALCVSAVVEGHVVPFQFVSPREVGARSDGGFAAVQWQAGPDSTGSAELSLYAARGGIPPFGAPPKYDATIDATSRPPVDGVVGWDTRPLAPGCYQPFAQMDDQIEGTTWRLAEGVVAVGPPDGGNVPPAIWTSPASPGATDGGWAFSWVLDDPEDPSAVVIEWVCADGGRGPVTGLAFDAGTHRATVVIPVSALPPFSTSHLRAEVRTADGRTCAAYSGPITVGALPDAGPDAGTPTADGGVVPPPPPTRPGCGCGAASGGWWLTAVLTAAGCGRRRWG